VRVIGRPEMAQDERFIDMPTRAGNAGIAVEILDAVFATKPVDEWVSILRGRRRFHLLSGEQRRRAARRSAGKSE
jgi:crotonobetainyl-CoA:carnitine CoA-transferase CaiB-like acyl-CoA transferase